MADQLGHHQHLRSDMIQKMLVTRAEVVQPRLAIGREGKTIFGTFALAGKAYFTGAAILRQQIAFIGSKLLLLRRVGHFIESLSVNIAELVLGGNKMVAGVKVAGMFQCQRRAAGFGKHAKRRPVTGPDTELNIKNLNKNAAYVALDPDIKNIGQKLAVLQWFHRPWGNLRHG